MSGTLRRLIPLPVYRVLPIRFVRWLFREELARGAEYAARMGWDDGRASRSSGEGGER